MKVLVMTVTAGEGHNTTAKSIAASLEKLGAETMVVDTCRAINPLFYHFIAKGYLLAVSPALAPVYAFGYGSLENRRKNAYRHSMTRFLYSRMRKKIRKIIESFQPDVIVYTHVFAGIALDVIRQKDGLLPKTVGIVTDFAMHPYWEEALRSDYVVVANDLVIPAAERKGFRKEQILPIGIPIRESFADATPKATARRELSLDPDKPTLLLMGGSMGHGHLVKRLLALDRLPVDLQIIVICGNNKKAKRKIDQLKTEKPLLVFGFTDKVSLCMDAADCIVSKPGGLTTSESLAKRLPMVICDPIPGQEDRNEAFLVNNGAAVAMMKGYDLSMAILQLFSHESRLSAMHSCIDYIRRPYATRELCELVLRLARETQKERENALASQDSATEAEL